MQQPQIDVAMHSMERLVTLNSRSSMDCDMPFSGAICSCSFAPTRWLKSYLRHFAYNDEKTLSFARQWTAPGLDMLQLGLCRCACAMRIHMILVWRQART